MRGTQVPFIALLFPLRSLLLSLLVFVFLFLLFLFLQLAQRDAQAGSNCDSKAQPQTDIVGQYADQDAKGDSQSDANNEDFFLILHIGTKFGQRIDIPRAMG